MRYEHVTLNIQPMEEVWSGFFCLFACFCCVCYLQKGTILHDIAENVLWQHAMLLCYEVDSFLPEKNPNHTKYVGWTYGHVPFTPMSKYF